jgi:antirestriction protein ArdC
MTRHHSNSSRTPTYANDGVVPTASQKRDLYQEVTDRIVAALEAGVVPWVRPWNTREGLPLNGATGRHYNGINVLLLWLTALQRGYTSPEWYTFNQACAAVGLTKDERGRWIHEAGKGVRKGERGTCVTFWRMITVGAHAETQSDGESDEQEIPLLRGYTVFNRKQIDGLLDVTPTAEPNAGESLRFHNADQFVTRTGAAVKQSRTALSPVYLPTKDEIVMPLLGCFVTVEDYYASLLHELVHWTGHPSRLHRLLTAKTETPEYAAEELVAELGAAFLCADLGVTGHLQQPEYIAFWLGALREDKRAIFRAASAARKAAAYLHDAGASPNQSAGALVDSGEDEPDTDTLERVA